MSKSSNLVKNTFTIGLGRLSTQFLTFLLLPIYTTYLTPAEFGQLDIVMLYVGLLAPVLTLQMEMAVFRHLIDARSNSQKTIEVLSSATLIVAGGTILGGVAIALIGILFDISYVWLLVGLFVSIVISNYLLQAVRGLGRNSLFAISSFVIGLMNIIFTATLVVAFSWGLEGVLSAVIIANMTGSAVLAIMAKIYRYIKLKAIAKSEVKALLDYSWPLIPNHVALWGIGGISRTIIVATLGFAAMGIFAAAAKFPLIYMALYGIFAMSWTEAASIHIKHDTDNFLSKITNNATRLLGSLAIIIIAITALTFPLFISSDFSAARQYVPLMLVGAFLGSIVTHYGAIYLALRKSKQVAVITMQAVILSTVLTLGAIGYIGLYAPIIALIFTYSFLAMRRHRNIQQYITIKYAKYTYPALILLSATVIGLYYMNNIYASVMSVFIAIFGSILLNYKSYCLVYRMFKGKIINRKMR